MIFEYIKPETVAEALEILERSPRDSRVLAGGTDLLVNIQEGVESPGLVVDIGGIEELGRLEEEGGSIRIGPLVTAAKIRRSGLLQDAIPLLVAACGEIGSPQIRSRATLGGNIVTASPSGDSLPALSSLSAVLTLRNGEGEREIPFEEFFTGVKKTVLKPAELLIEIAVPRPGDDSRWFFRKLGQRRALAISKVSVAGFLKIREGAVEDARIALGAVATTVIRAEAAEDFLRGKKLEPPVIRKAGEICAEESRAITDIRSTAGYRDEMAGLLLSRGLEEISGE